MAPSFGRSISFPLTPSKPRHVRSVSLPCSSSHPLLAVLHAHTAAARSWAALAGPAAALPSAGLAHLAALHASLADILLLPQTRAALRCAAGNGGDRLLDAFLVLADAHQGFQDAVLELKAHASEAQAALRRGFYTASAARCNNQRRADKDLARLAARCTRLKLSLAGAEDDELSGALVGAAAASAAASAAVFSAAAAMSMSSSSGKKKNATAFVVFARNKATAAPETEEAAMERLQALERCLDECDGLCDQVFRSVVRTRVSLLNIMTPTI